MRCRSALGLAESYVLGGTPLPSRVGGVGATSKCLVGRIVVPIEMIVGGLSESSTLFLKGSAGAYAPDLKVPTGLNLIGSQTRSMGPEGLVPHYGVKPRFDPLTH